MNKGIQIDHVSFSYEQSVKRLDDISLDIKQGDFCGIVGTNGSGKTTFTLLLNGLIPHHIKGYFKGNVFVDGINTRSQSIAYFSSRIGMLFQNPDFMIFNLTVKEEVEFGLKNLKLGNQEQRIKNALEIVGLTGFENRDPHSLSFGQKQKLCLACILALDTEYIVLDEPVAMLDYDSSIKLYDLLRSLNKNGKTIIVVEHDTDYLKKYATHIVVLDKGRILLKGTVEQVFQNEKLLQSIGIKIPRNI